MIVHNELGHEEVDGVDAYGKPARTCSLYPGMSCREHVNAAVDVDGAREEELIRVPFVELCPNSWLVLPTGTVEAVTEEDQFLPARIQAQAKRVQKELGASLDRAALDRLTAALRRGDEALDEDHFGEALAAWAGCTQVTKAPHASLQALLDARLAQAEESVTYEFEDLSEPGPKDLRPEGERIQAVRALLEQVEVAVCGQHLPVRARMQAWLAQREGVTPGNSRK